MVVMTILIFVFLLMSKVNLLVSTMQQSQSAPPTSTTSGVLVARCMGSGYCLRFKHESELILPTNSTGGCEPYKLPELGDLPSVSEIQITPGTDSSQTPDILLKYIEKVLDADKGAKATLLKHYQDYLADCTKTQGVPTPVPTPLK
jgi:hypothetical protein